jgi:rhodanese-related sulfurtransferase
MTAMTADELLAEARAELDRVDPHAADELHRSGALLVDIRPHAFRAAEGEIAGAVVIERNVLEWRLDPVGRHRIEGFTPDTPVVVLCNEGYASSLAARDLRRLGLRLATDLVGGFRGWRAAGLPTVPGGSLAIP